MSAYVQTRKGQTLEVPSFINLVFSDKRFSILWLAVRVWLGWQWIEASLHKLSNPAWMQTGDALKGFWMGAIQIPAEGRRSRSLSGEGRLKACRNPGLRLVLTRVNTRTPGVVSSARMGVRGASWKSWACASTV